MRKFIISAIVAAVAAVSFAAPSQAGGYGYNKSYGHKNYGYAQKSYGHKQYGYKSHAKSYGYTKHYYVKKSYNSYNSYNADDSYGY